MLRPLKIPKSACQVVSVRPERGYSATNYDGSPANPSKSLRRQFGQKYDVKKVRNNYHHSVEKTLAVGPSQGE